MGNVQMDADQIRYKDSTGTYRNVQTGLAAAIEGGGGGSGTLAGLSDTDISSPTNGQVLAYDSTEAKWVNASGGSGATTLDGLTDTDISTPADGQVLTYDATAEKWENAAIPAQSIDGLSDTTITTPSDGQVLTYDATTEKWKNAAGGSGGGEIYPLVETKIGKWGNDDLYRVVVDSTNTGSTITVDLSAYVSSLSNLRALHGYATYTATVDYMVPLPYVSGSGNNTKSIMLFAIVNDDKVVLRINNSLGTFTDPHYYIAIDYVKTVTP